MKQAWENKSSWEDPNTESRPAAKDARCLGCRCKPVFWENEYPNTNGETDHQGPVFIQTYKQPHGLAVTQEGNIIQRMKVCLERRITLYSRLSPSSPHPEQTGLRGAFPSLLCLGEGVSLASTLLSEDSLL